MNSELEFTGERYIPGTEGVIQLEHVQRYAIVKDLVKGKRVLDIACGEGYGTAMLAESAGYVTGVDISTEAIEHAKLNYINDNVEFKSGSCELIPLNDNSVDVVVSFETIEHHEKHEEMLSEIKRVLKSNGTLIISTPDKMEYSDKPGYRNEFHVKELYKEEFIGLIRQNFKHLKMYDQYVLYGSKIVESKTKSEYVSYCDALFYREVKDADKLYPVYLIALASNNDLGNLPNTLFPGDLRDYCQKITADVTQQLMAEKANARAQIEHRDAVIDELQQRLEAEQTNATAQIQYRDELIGELEQQLAAGQVSVGAQAKYHDELASELGQQLATEQAKARDQIQYRDELIAELRQQLTAEQDNAGIQAKYHDELTGELGRLLATEQAKARARIQYRDSIISELQQELKQESVISSLLNRVKQLLSSVGGKR